MLTATPPRLTSRQHSRQRPARRARRRRHVLVLIAVMAFATATWLVVSKPGSATTGTIASTTSTATASTASTDTAPTATTAPAAAGGMTTGPRNRDVFGLLNPLREADAPDPFVAVDGERAWLFTTNTANGNVPTWSWHNGQLTVTDALPTLPAWTHPGSTWAPAVTHISDHWLLAFTAPTTSGRQCIGVATASTPTGPYTPQPQPLMCDLARGGSIDPSLVTDDAGTTWLLFKDDGNCCDLPTTLRSVPLTADGLALAGWPQDLIGADQAWEGGLVEAPTMARVGGGWLLLYSANRWDGAAYAVGAAWRTSPSGPCTKQPGPVLTAQPGLDGPGGAEFVAGSRNLVFHAWPPDRTGYTTGATRSLHIGRIDPTTTPGDPVQIATPDLPQRQRPPANQATAR